MTCPYLRQRGGRDLCTWLDDWYPYRDAVCCPDTCPCGPGPWGAWRGTVMQHVEAFEFYSWLDIPYGGSLQTDFKTHGDVCRSCEYGIDYKGRSFCCKPCCWVGGRTHGVRDCSAYVRSGVGWSP